jgi:hypothetical protein
MLGICVGFEVLTAVVMALLATWFMLVSCLAYSSTLMMKVTSSSETLVDLQWTTLCYIPEDRTLC